MAFLGRLSAIINIPVVVFGGLWALGQFVSIVASWKTYTDTRLGQVEQTVGEIRRQIETGDSAQARQLTADFQHTRQQIITEVTEDNDKTRAQLDAAQEDLANQKRRLDLIAAQNGNIERELATMKCKVFPKRCSNEP